MKPRFGEMNPPATGKEIEAGEKVYWELAELGAKGKTVQWTIRQHAKVNNAEDDKTLKDRFGIRRKW